MQASEKQKHQFPIRTGLSLFNVHYFFSNLHKRYLNMEITLYQSNMVTRNKEPSQHNSFHSAVSGSSPLPWTDAYASLVHVTLFLNLRQSWSQTPFSKPNTFVNYSKETSLRLSFIGTQDDATKLMFPGCQCDPSAMQASGHCYRGAVSSTLLLSLCPCHSAHPEGPRC